MLPNRDHKMPLLQARDVGIHFGGLKALEGLSFDIFSRQLMGLIGPNGAGKTTAFNILSGVYRPTSGSIEFLNQSLVGLKPSQINNFGVARTFQNIRLFANLTVLENVRIAAHRDAKYSLVAAAVRSARFFREENQQIEKAKKLLELFGLAADVDVVAHSLPYGKQRRLEIVRALATHPKLLLLDEPAAGMNPVETRDLMNLIRRVRDEFDLAILLIEHDMKLVMGLCEDVMVLDHGVVIAHGPPEKVQSDPKVIEAYLGTAEVSK